VDVAYNGLFLQEHQLLISRLFLVEDLAVLRDTIMTLVTVVRVVTIMKKLFVEKRETLIQLQAQNQFIHFVPGVLHNVLVVFNVIEIADTVVDLM
jgi:hypothetical protein